MWPQICFCSHGSTPLLRHGIFWEAEEFTVLCIPTAGHAAHTEKQNINVICWMLCGRYQSGNFGGCVVMSAVQQRVLLLRHGLEGGRDCIFRREWAHSLNKQRQALCLRMLWLLWPSYFYAVQEREGRREEGFFFWVKHCASSLWSLQVDRALQVLGTSSA